MAPASTELTTPANSTPKATSAIASAASHGVREQSVPTQMKHPLVTASGRLRLQPRLHRPGEVDEQEHREGAEGGEGRDRRVADHERSPARTSWA